MKGFDRLIILILLTGFVFFTGCGDEKAETETTPKEALLSFPDYAYKQFEGTINGNLPISCIIMRKDTCITGYYFYHSQKHPIQLSGNIDKNYQLKLYEYIEVLTPNGLDIRKTGEFAGKWENGVWKGSWKNEKNNFPFELKEASPPGSAAISVNFTEKKYNSEKKGNAEISYLTIKVASCGTEATKKAINIDMENTLLAEYSPEGGTPTRAESIEKMMDEFIEGYKKEEDNMDSALGYTSNTEQFIEMNHGNILCIGQLDYLYMGGAHGSSASSYYNYDLRSGKKITLKDLLVAGFEKSLNPLAEKYFRVQNEIPPGKSLEEEGYFWGEAFSLTDNFALQPDGILFEYNPYEIAAYYRGTSQVLIPYSAIKNLIKPGSVLEEYIRLFPEIVENKSSAISN